MRCRDLHSNMAAIELFASRKIDPALRVKFAQRLLRLREAFRLLREEMASMARQYARQDESGQPLYGPEDEQGNRNIIIDDPEAYDRALRALFAGEADVTVQPFGNELLAKAKEYTPSEVAALIAVGLLNVPEDAPTTPSEDEE